MATMDDLDPAYKAPILRVRLTWAPVAGVYVLHTDLRREGEQPPDSMTHIDYYVGRQDPTRAVLRALARECDDLRAIREADRAVLPF